MKIKRWQWLAAAMAVTITMVVWTARRDEADQAQVAESKTKRPGEPVVNFYSRVAKTTTIAISDVGRDSLISTNSDPFKVVNFIPPPPPATEVVPPPPPPKPSAPTFPYRYFGTMVDLSGKKEIYLQKGDSYEAIREHQILDGNYRIDSIDERQIVITYLPLEEKNILMIQSAEN